MHWPEKSTAQIQREKEEALNYSKALWEASNELSDQLTRPNQNRPQIMRHDGSNPSVQQLRLNKVICIASPFCTKSCYGRCEHIDESTRRECGALTCIEHLSHAAHKSWVTEYNVSAQLSRFNQHLAAELSEQQRREEHRGAEVPSISSLKRKDDLIAELRRLQRLPANINEDDLKRRTTFNQLKEMVIAARENRPPLNPAALEPTVLAPETAEHRPIAIVAEPTDSVSIATTLGNPTASPIAGHPDMTPRAATAPPTSHDDIVPLAIASTTVASLPVIPRATASRANAGRANAGRSNTGRGNAGRGNAGRGNTGRGNTGRVNAGRVSVRQAHARHTTAPPDTANSADTMAAVPSDIVSTLAIATPAAEQSAIVPLSLVPILQHRANALNDSLRSADLAALSATEMGLVRWIQTLKAEEVSEALRRLPVSTVSTLIPFIIPTQSSYRAIDNDSLRRLSGDATNGGDAVSVDISSNDDSEDSD